MIISSVNFDGLVRLLKKKSSLWTTSLFMERGLVFRSHLFLLGRQFRSAPIQLGPLSIPKGLFDSRISRGGEERDFNGGEGRGDILIKNVFGSQGEGRGRDFKIILLFYP